LLGQFGGYGDNVNGMSDKPLVSFDTSKPNIARAYDFMLGGKDNFAADRELAAKLLEIYPLAGALARENRGFLARAVDLVSRHGVNQFIDVGSGLPTSPNTHEVASAVSEGARVVYVDNDPVVISHARALLAEEGNVAAVPGDARRPEEILASPALAAMIDLNKPACVILTMILHFLESSQAQHIVSTFVRALAPGSFLIISVGVSNHAPDLSDRVTTAYTAGALHEHDRQQIAGLFTGLEILEPGLTEVRNWPSTQPDTVTPERPADVLAGVGRKPTPATLST
jgi:O-methyltransferase involved in polyketide biosynthesis